MTTCISFERDEYFAWKLDMSEQMEDGIRPEGCWINRFDDEEQYIIAKGNSINFVEAKW